MNNLKLLCNGNNLGIGDFDSLNYKQCRRRGYSRWVKDSIMSAYSKMVHHTCNNNNYVMDSLWYSSLISRMELKSLNIDEVLANQKSGVNYDMLDRDNVYFPILKDKHWLLIRACRINGSVTIYDSLRDAHNQKAKADVLAIGETVKSYLSATNLSKMTGAAGESKDSDYNPLEVRNLLHASLSNS